MEAAIRDLHTDTVHAAIARVVGVDAADLRTLGGFESFVYETEVAGEPRIVKATWSGRRTPAEIGAELHFLRYLADNGAAVCAGLPLASGNLIESVLAGDGAFHVHAFERAPGERLPRAQWDDAHVERWGALIGVLHRLSATYDGPPPPLARPTWERDFVAAEPWIVTDPLIDASYREVFAQIAALPRDAGTFGTMHTDLHGHNLHWKDGQPCAFDFDDMVDFWFISDLAIVLFYGVMGDQLTQAQRQSEYERMHAALFKGYASEYELPAWCHDALPLFLRIREHLLRALIVRSFSEEERTPPWQRYVTQATERIKGDRLPFDIQIP